MQALQFDTHLGQFYSLARVRTDYPLLRFMKIYYLECHLVCAMDTALNLHFIQIREPNPEDPKIYPSSCATSNKAQILFTIEPLTLFREARGKCLKEKEFTEFFVKLDYMWENEPEICLIRPGAFLFKPVKNGSVYLLDLTIPNNKPELVSQLLEVETLSLWRENIVLFSSKTMHGIFLYHLQTQKIKRLKFTKTSPSNLKVIGKNNLCVAVFERMLEILDMMTNKVIERFMFESFSDNLISISPQGSRMIHTYLYGKLLDGNMYMDVWEFSNGTKLSKRDPFHLDDSLQNEHHIEFLDENLVIHIRRWQLDILKIEGSGIIKLHTFEIPYDYGFVKSSEEGHCIWSQLSLAVINPSHFLLLTSDVFEDGYNRIEGFNLNIQQTDLNCLSNPNFITNNKQDENMSLQSIEKRRSVKESMSIVTTVTAQAKLLFLEKVDFINSVCTWQTQKAGILYDSNRFYEYNLLNGKLMKVTSITGLSHLKEHLKRIKYVDENHIALFYQKEEIFKLRVIIINLEGQTKVFDSKEFLKESQIKDFQLIEVVDRRVLFLYKKYQNNDGFLGELDLNSREIIDIFQIDSNKKIEEIWDIGDQNIAARCRHAKSTLQIWNLQSKKMLFEKKFAAFQESSQEEEATYTELFFWSVTRINSEVIAFMGKGIVSSGSAVIIFNWKQDKIIAKCEVKAEEIFGFLNDELFVLLEDYFPQNADTFYATIPIARSLLSMETNKMINLNYKHFGKFFLGFEKSSFECLSNNKHAILVIKQFFPHNIFIMRRRNKRVELLRHIKKELADHYHPYLVQDVVKMIVG